MSIRSMLSALSAVVFASASCIESAAAGAETEDDPLTLNELYNYVEGATVAILLHEVGHALVEIYQLPIVGGHEDAADEFAAMFIIEQAMIDDSGHFLADAMADFFYSYVEQSQKTGDGKIHDFVYWDEHDLGERRAFDILCDMYGAFSQRHEELRKAGAGDEMYGAFPQRYEEKLRKAGASDERLRRCVKDFKYNQKSWRRLLRDYRRNSAVAAAMRQMTAEKLDALFRYEPTFQVTYAPGSQKAGEPGLFDLLHRSDRVFQHHFLDRNETLRYHLLAYVANLLTTEFILTSGDADDQPPEGERMRVGSLDIFSQECGDENAFYVESRRTIYMCHELQPALANAYVRYRTGEDPDDWWAWRGQFGAYSTEAILLAGEWRAEDGSGLRLNKDATFTIRGDARLGFAARHGVWGIDGDALWLIETRRDGVECFNPACRPSLSMDGLSERELASLRYGVIPRGEVLGTFAIAPCKLEEAALDRNGTRETDPLIMMDESPCANYKITALEESVAIDGVVFERDALRDLAYPQ